MTDYARIVLQGKKWCLRAFFMRLLSNLSLNRKKSLKSKIRALEGVC